MPFTADEIARHLKGQVQGNGAIQLTGFAPANTARPGDLTFAENEKYFAAAEQSAASAILVDGEFGSASKVLIKVRNARIAFAKVLPLFFPPPTFALGIHPTAIIAASAKLDPTVHIGPWCVIGERVSIGPRSVVQAGACVGDDCQLGEEAHLYPNVTLYPCTQLGNRVMVHAGTVIGSDGFGYVFDEGIHFKVQQIGNVIIHDDVEIGANVTIDRGALGSTIVGKGTKIDNLVQLGHNVIIGEHCILVSQAGIAGSTKLGNYVTLAGQAGIAGHLKIGDRAIVAAQAGVMNDIPEGGKYIGAPAQPDRQMKRQWIALRNMPELMQRIHEMEARLKELENRKNE